MACSPPAAAPPDPNNPVYVLLLLPPILLNHWFLFNLFNFFLFCFGIEQYIDTSFGYCCIFFLFILLCFIYLSTVGLALLTEHTTLCVGDTLRGKQYMN